MSSQSRSLPFLFTQPLAPALLPWQATLPNFVSSRVCW